jgi:hypothetical protein
MKQQFLEPGRNIVWFSHGAASACLSKLASDIYGNDCEYIYCNTSADEHQDNVRFRRDVEQWIGREIKFIGSTKYKTCDEVFEAESYMSGPGGARCTVELKKIPRFAFQWPQDIHHFGYTANEKRRIRDFEANNPELFLKWLLRDRGLTKKNCFSMLRAAGIALPTMYLLGYRNNNCKGCVKSTSPGYWAKIRKDFPEVFKSRAERSRALGVRLVELRGERIFLDELPDKDFIYKGEDLSCGPQCSPPKN